MNLANGKHNEVHLRSRPAIYYFWPTLILATLFMAWAGIIERQLAGVFTVNLSLDSLREAVRFSPMYRLPLLDESYALCLCLAVAIVAALYVVLAAFSTIGLKICELPGKILHNRIVAGLSLMTFVYLIAALFLAVSPGYGLLMIYTLFTIGLMTDHDSFSKVGALRIKLFWSVIFTLAAVILTVLHSIDTLPNHPTADAGGGEYTLTLKLMSMLFFVVFAFNMFVLAFDFHGANLIGLISGTIAIVTIFVCAVVMVPDVKQFFVIAFEQLLDLKINSSFYKFYAYTLSALMVFAGLIAKADYWTIERNTVTHFSGLLVQRNRNFGHVVNLPIYVEYPDAFETLLGFGSGNFVFHLPNQPRPETVDNVWRATKYNADLQKLND